MIIILIMIIIISISLKLSTVQLLTAILELDGCRFLCAHVIYLWNTLSCNLLCKCKLSLTYVCVLLICYKNNNQDWLSKIVGNVTVNLQRLRFTYIEPHTDCKTGQITNISTASLCIAQCIMTATDSRYKPKYVELEPPLKTLHRLFHIINLSIYVSSHYIPHADNNTTNKRSTNTAIIQSAAVTDRIETLCMASPKAQVYTHFFNTLYFCCVHA